MGTLMLAAILAALAALATTVALAGQPAATVQAAAPAQASQATAPVPTEAETAEDDPTMDPQAVAQGTPAEEDDASIGATLTDFTYDADIGEDDATVLWSADKLRDALGAVLED